jgi:hypothetical protein
VHWQDGHDSVFFPSADCVVDHHPRQSARKSARK